MSTSNGLSDIPFPFPLERGLRAEATILIFEDEIYNFRLLRHQLLEINPDFDVIGPLSTVEEGRAFLAFHHDVDLIIADIQLNDGLSFDALAYASDDIPVIFTTAYDEYALRAFDYNSLSYLLKPIDEARLRKAIDKAFRNLDRRSIVERKIVGRCQTTADSVDGHLAELQTPELQTPNNLPPPVSSFQSIASAPNHRHCFLVKTSRGERRVHVSMVRYIASEDKTTFVYLLDGTSYPVDLTLSELALQLDPSRFMRVSRKFILPHEQVKGLEHLANGRIQLSLYGIGSPEVVVSRAMRKAVIDWIGS